MPRSDGYKNLKPIASRTKDELRSMTTKGGIASGVARRKAKTIKEILREAMKGAAPKDAVNVLVQAFGLDPKDITNADAMIYAQMHKAIAKRDTAAFNAVLDRVDGKPMQAVEHTGADGSAINVNLNFTPKK